MLSGARTLIIQTTTTTTTTTTAAAAAAAITAQNRLVLPNEGCCY